MDKKKGRELHQWLRDIRAATRKEALRRKCEERVQIVEYMTAVQRQQQSAAPRVLWQQSIATFVSGRQDRSPCTTGQRSAPGPLQVDVGLATLLVISQRKLQEFVANPGNN